MYSCAVFSALRKPGPSVQDPQAWLIRTLWRGSIFCVRRPLDGIDFDHLSQGSRFLHSARWARGQLHCALQPNIDEFAAIRRDVSSASEYHSATRTLTTFCMAVAAWPESSCQFSCSSDVLPRTNIRRSLWSFACFLHSTRKTRSPWRGAFGRNIEECATPWRGSLTGFRCSATWSLTTSRRAEHRGWNLDTDFLGRLSGITGKHACNSGLWFLLSAKAFLGIGAWFLFRSSAKSGPTCSSGCQQCYAASSRYRARETQKRQGSSSAPSVWHSETSMRRISCSSKIAPDSLEVCSAKVFSLWDGDFWGAFPFVSRLVVRISHRGQLRACLLLR